MPSQQSVRVKVKIGGLCRKQQAKKFGNSLAADLRKLEDFGDWQGVCIAKMSKNLNQSGWGKGVAGSYLLDPDVPFAPRHLALFYGWVILLGATLGIILSIPGQTMGVSVFTDILIEQLELSRVQLSFAYLCGTVVSGLLVSWGGKMFDRFGARLVMLVSCLLFGLALATMGQVDVVAAAVSNLVGGKVQQLVPFIVIAVGFFTIRFLGQGMLTITSRAMLGKWFNKRRGLAFAINGVFVSFGFSLAPVMLDNLIVFFGWRGAYLFLGLVIGLGMGLLAWLLYRDNPEECGLVMDGGEVKRKHAVQEAPPVVHEWTLAEALRTPAFWAFNFGTSWFSLLTTAYTFHVLSIGDYAGVDKDAVLALFIPMAVVGIFSNFVAGWLSDRVAMNWILCGLLGSLLAGSLGMLWLDSTLGRWFIIIGLGVAGGCFQTCIGVTWPRFFGRAHVGAISGLNMSSIVIASALGPFLFSLSERLSGDYQWAFIFSLAVPLLLLAPALIARNPQRQQ